MVKIREIELSLLRTCPVRCVYCPQDLLKSKVSTRVPNYMPLSVLKDVLCNATSGFDKPLKVHFAGFTEPLKHPEFLDLIWQVQECSMVKEIILYTTGEGLSLERLRMLSRITKLTDVTFNVNWQQALGPRKSSIQTNGTGEIWKIRDEVASVWPNATWGFVQRTSRIRRIEIARLHPKIKIRWPKKVGRAGNLARQSRQAEPIVTHDGAVWCYHTERRRRPVVLPDGSCMACCQDYGLDLPVGSLRTMDWETLTYHSVLKRQQAPSKDSPCHTGCHFAELIDE